MGALARLLARYCWWLVLYTMRRPGMKRLQRAWLRRLVRPHRREAAWRSLVAQNRFARRHGLLMLTVSFNALLASVALTLAYYAVVALYVNGYLTPPGPEVRVPALRR